MGKSAILLVPIVAALLLAACQKTGRSSPTPALQNPVSAPAPAPVVPATAPAPPPPSPAGAPRSPPAAVASPPRGDAGAAFSAQAGAAGPAQGGAAGPQAGALVSPQPGVGAQKGLASAASLMALGRDRRIMPEDFKIGALGDDRTERKDDSRALAAAGQFLSRLVAGKVDTALLADASRDRMTDSLSFGIKQGNLPTSFRLGAPQSRDDGEVAAAVRLFGPLGTSEGEIYLAPSGSVWLVADLQLSLAQLSVKPEKPKEKFFPLEYRWLLEE